MKKEETILRALQSNELPTLPTVATQLITLTAREDTTLADIANLISQDIALSSKILKVSNSAFYSFPQQISSITQAVSLLGTNAVRSLALSFSFLSIKANKKSNQFDFKDFWQKSLASAVAAKLILEHVKGANSDEVLVSGLLQNLGQLIFALTFAEDYEKVLTKNAQQAGSDAENEKEIFGLDHYLMGYETAKAWGFPESLCLPILYHHTPEEYSGDNKQIQTTIFAIYLSDILTKLLYSDSPEIYHKKFRKQASSLLNLNNLQIDEILNHIHTEIKEASSYFDLKIDKILSVQEILQEANIRLSLLNLDYAQINKQLIETTIKLENLTQELESKNRLLENLANIDGLTNIYNHRYFQNSLDQEINRSTRRQLSISLVMLDIDHFKKFNDTYGHQVGDFILIELSKLLKKNIRKYDTLARYGGEEFFIILPETDLNEALGVAEKIRLSIESHSFDDGNESYNVTASFGVSESKPATEDDFSKNAFLNNVDSALYTAKKKGRNQVAEYKEKKKGWFKK